MFFQRDYILRMIEMMGDLMRRVQELMNGLERMKALDEACRIHAGISLETAEQLTKESLKALLPRVPRMMMSEILYIRAESVPMPTDQQEALLHKSLHLLASLWEEGPLCELRADRLADLKQQLLPLLDAEEIMNCARFFAEAECFSHMEDAIFQAAELSLESRLLSEGMQMLEAAACAAPKALIFAGTSRDEMLEAVQALKRLGAVISEKEAEYGQH